MHSLKHKVALFTLTACTLVFLTSCKGDTKTFLKSAKKLGFASYTVDLNLVELESGVEKRFPVTETDGVVSNLSEEEKIFLNKSYDNISEAIGKQFPWPVVPISPKFSTQYKTLETIQDAHVYSPKGQGAFKISTAKTAQMLCNVADQDGLIAAKLTFIRIRQDDFLQGFFTKIKVRLILNIVDDEGKNRLSREIWGESKSILKEDSIPQDFKATHLKHSLSLNDYNRHLYREALSDLEEKLSKELAKLKLTYGKQMSKSRKKIQPQKQDTEISGSMFKAMQVCYRDLGLSGLNAKDYDISADEDGEDFILFFNSTINGQDFVYYVDKETLKIREKIEQK